MAQRPAAKQPANLSIPRLVITAFAMALAPLLVLWAYGAWELTSTRSDARSAIGEGMAARYAGVVGGRVTGLIAQADMLAADTEVAAAVASGDSERIAQMEQLLTKRFPGALRTRLAQHGREVKPDQMMPPTGYAAIDLLDRTEAGQRPPVEVHMFGTPNQQLVVARPVQGPDGKVAGGVLFSLDVNSVRKWLQATAVDGYLEVRQVAGDQVLGSTGNEAAKQGDPFKSPIDGAAWQAVYWPAAGIASGGWIGLIGVGIVAVLLLAGVMFLLSRQIGSHLQNDLGALVRLLLARRGAARAQPLRLLEFKRVMAEIERKREGTSRSSMLQVSEEKSGGESDLIFMPKDALRVETLDDDKKSE